VSVSFSGNWLLNVLQTNHTLQDLQDKIGRLQKLEVVQKMTPEEREIVKELFLENRQQHFRSFYIKAAVLKLVCDFLHRLRNEQPFLAKSGISATLEEVEQYLNEHITKEFTGTKVLAEQFSVSESTLKRHFQKKYGVTIAAYITSKKMQTAKSLVDEQGIKIADAALMLGYRSIQNFKEIFTKYHHCTMVKKNEQITGENISCS
jgi:AraC-like DNA-binding protein